MAYKADMGLLAAFGVLVLGLVACGGDDSDVAPQPLELTLLHINDHHSALDARSKTFKLANAAGTRGDVAASVGGFPRVTAAIEALAAASPNVLKLHAGDAQTGTLYFNRAGQPGEADAALMNTVCFDAMAVGNHEFDKGDAGLKSFIDLLHAGSCKTPVLSANVNFGASSVLNPTPASGYVQRSTVLRRGGQDIGIIGLTIAAKTKQSSSPDPDTTFEDEAVAAQREIDALRARGINKIVLLSHIGYGLDQEVIAKLSGVDVVVGGDSHTLVGPTAMSSYGVGSPAGSYPTRLSNKDGEPVCLVQAWEYSQIVGELKVSFDAQGKVTNCQGTPHVLIGDSFTVAGKAAEAADKAAFLADASTSGFLRVTAPSSRAQAVLDPFKAKVDVFSKSVVATVPDELCSRRVPGGPGSRDFSRSSVGCNALGQVDQRGGDIQQLVAQAYLEVANAQYGGADISLQSGGGVRVPLLGQVTAANVIEVVPFGNMLFRLDITGQEAKDMLEDGLQATFGPGGSTGPYPYTGGLRFAVDATQPQGSRVSQLQVFNRTTSTWDAIDLTRSYKLFVLSFNATGGDGYSTLAKVPAARRQDIGVLDADVLQAYIDRQAKEVSSGLPLLRRLDPALYSTQRFVGP